jgi:hypothetical protein
VVHEIVPDVRDSFDVIASLLQPRITCIPAEAHQENSALYTQAGLLEKFASFGRRCARTNRIVDQDNRLRPVKRSFDQLQRAVLLPLLAQQQTTILAV